jgi:hypothetical protein
MLCGFASQNDDLSGDKTLAFNVSRFIISGWLLIASSNLHGAFPFEEARPHYVGARALSMGNAFTAVADDATAGFWNPAGLIQWQGVKIFGVNKFHDRSDYAFDPKGIGYAYRGYGLFWGNKIALGVASGTPDFNYYSAARQVSAHIAVGGSLKFKRKHPSESYQFFGADAAYDLALLVKPRSDFKVGMLAQHLPRQKGIRWLTVGLAYQRRKLLFAADVAFPQLGFDEAEFYAGVEWRATRFIQLRGGRSNQDWTWGAGVEWKWLRMDYGRIYEPGFSSDFISLELRL